MRVAATGADGFVGRHAIARLLFGGHEVRALISERPGAEKELPGASTNVDVRRVDVRKPETLRGAFDGVDAVIHTVAVPTERKERFADVNVAGVAHVVAEARRAGVRRIVHMGALRADRASPYPYLRSKGEGEALITGSGISHVVLQPSLLFGEGDDFFPRLAFSLIFPVVPVPGDGKARFQPVHVDDIAAALVAAVEHREISAAPIQGRSGLPATAPGELKKNRFSGVLPSSQGRPPRIRFVRKPTHDRSGESVGGSSFRLLPGTP